MFALTNPNRVFVELPDVKLQLPPHPGDAPIGLVKSFRGGLAGAGKARVVIDVTGPVIVEKAVVEKTKDGTAKLVLEIVPASSVTDAKLANARRAIDAGGRGRPRRQQPAAADAAAGDFAAACARSSCTSR